MPIIITRQEVARHATKADLWCIIHNQVWDLTDFLPNHPGGAGIILKYAGKDATAAFDPIHPKDIMEKLLPPTAFKGMIDPNDVDTSSSFTITKKSNTSSLPPLSSMLNLFDFEFIAQHTLSPEALAYYSSASDDEITLRENHAAFHRIWWKPRILVNVTDIDLSTTMLKRKISLPIYITATALGKLGHPDGELCLTRAAYSRKIPQMIPTLASYSLQEITQERINLGNDMTQFFQLYVNKDRRVTEALIKQAESRGCLGLFVTVDAPQLGRRERDMRMKFSEEDDANVQKGDEVDRSQGAARAISSFIDPGLCWADISWMQSITKLPIILKGVQCGEDVVLARKHKLQGVVLSNHGGRQLDTSRSGIEILPEAVRHLRQSGYSHPDSRFEIYVDGGFRRGADVLKAIALGATSVGLGRPFLWAMSSYGTKGVERAIDLLQDEMIMTMRLLGVTSIEQLRRQGESLVDITSLSLHVGDGGAVRDVLGNKVYQPLSHPTINSKSKL